MNSIRILVHERQTDVGRAAEELKADENVDIQIEPETGNFDPVLVAVIVAASLAAAKLILRIWREVRGGTVINLQTNPIDVSRDHDLDWGFYLIIAKDGSVTIEAKDEPKDALERLVGGTLEQASGATVKSVKELADGILGQGSKVSTSQET